MASYTVSKRGKPILEYDLAKYTLVSTRKDGSEVWKCIELECQGRLLKRIVNQGGVHIITKEHTQDLPSFVQMIIHLTLGKLKERAVSDPTVPPAQILQQTMKDMRDSMDAYMPPPSMMMNLVAKWRNEEQESSTIDENISASPHPNNMTSRPKKTPTRKRIKLGMDTESPKLHSNLSVQDRNSLKNEIEDDFDSD